MNLARTARAAAISILISIGTLATVFSMFIGMQSCAWFDKHVEPVVKPIATCAGQSVSAADFQEAVNDLRSKDYGDLASMGIRLGWDVLACVIDNIGQQDPSLKTNGAEFKTQHAKQIEAAQRPSVSVALPIPGALLIRSGGTIELRSPGDPQPTTGPVWPSDQNAKYSYAGESVGAASQRCDRACAPAPAIGSPGGDCLCWREPTRSDRGHWIAARGAPPGFRPGLAVAGGDGR